jgi:hypothetical protein
MWFTGLTSRCLLSVSREPRNPLGPRAIKGRGVAAPAVMPMPVSVTANVIQSRAVLLWLTDFDRDGAAVGEFVGIAHEV